MICVVMIILVIIKHTARCADYSSRQLIRSMSPEAYKSLVPPHYEKYAPPATDDKPAIVYFDMRLLDITSINENDMTFSVESFITYRWKDWRLRWPLEEDLQASCWNPPPENITGPLQFSKICSDSYTPIIHRCIDANVTQSKRLILNSKVLEDIWQPDAFFKNGIRSSVHKDWVANEYLALYTYDGHLRLLSRMSITLGCHFDFHHYPHDEQQCEMLIESLSHKLDLVQFDWCEQWAEASSKLDDGLFSLPHFSLVKYEHTPCGAMHPCVKAVFILRRHPDFHILHTYVPTVLIVILSWMSFWISPDATPVSYIKYLDIWMITCMVYVFAALLEFAIVYHVHNKRHVVDPHNANEHDTAKLNGRSSSTIIVNMENIDVITNPNMGILTRWILSWQRFRRKVTAIDEASRVLFPATYVSFIAAYFLLLTGSQEKEPISTEIPD